MKNHDSTHAAQYDPFIHYAGKKEEAAWQQG
jgi:hypothetical protein